MIPDLRQSLSGADVNTDVAVLKIEREEAFPVLPLAGSSKVRVGQFAIAIGNPFRLDYTVTTGVVSGKGRSILQGFSLIRYQDFIQTDAWINTGSSGGSLLNIRGEVIGINALIRRLDSGENTPAPVMAGAGFAIPINLVKTVGDQLINSGRVIRGYLGVSDAGDKARHPASDLSEKIHPHTLEACDATTLFLNTTAKKCRSLLNSKCSLQSHR